MVRYTESARERELFRYYKPAEYITPEQNVPAQSSTDTAITAFAQLGALRLNATRCIIVLVGSKSEYILAEASKTLSLQDDQVHEPGDELRRGAGAIKARTIIGSLLVSLLTGDARTKPVEHVLIHDLQADERFSGLDVQEHLGVRSLACLPLRSPKGYVIGLYCVVDEKPREHFTDVEIRFVKDMAVTTMDHIEAGRGKQRHYRAERMVKALAIYLEGGHSLREWWLSQAADGRSTRQNVRGGSLEHQADVKFGVQDGPDSDKYSVTSIEELQGNSTFHAKYSRPGTAYSTASEQEISLSASGRPSFFSTTVTTTASSEPPMLVKSEATPSERSTDPTTPLLESAPSLAIRSPEPEMNLPGKELQEALLSADVRKSFSRASNLIREAIDLDGVAFYDASIGSFGAGSSKEVMNQTAPGIHKQDSVPDTTSSGSDSAKVANEQSKQEPEATRASILGYSTRNRSSLKHHADSEKLRTFSEPLLRKLAKRYPHGKVFTFEDDGSISSSDHEGPSPVSETSTQSLAGSVPELSPESKARVSKKLLNRQTEAAAILEVIPGARSVAWYPLWDGVSERWYAGALIWSMCPARVLCPEDELTYMAAWGNSIMAEVSRLSALVAARMKVDFVSSISHELRSPLHGILASVEFLQEEKLPDMHADMVNTIHSCGKTLLDTIDHVLEFAKVTKKSKKPSGTSRRSRASHRDSTEKRRSEESLSNVHILAEEVIDSVYTGRRHTKGNHSKDPLPPHVVVILDIAYESNWVFKLNVGAFRRVLMNIFSNALKYTESGFVKVCLSLEHKPRPIIHITVTDSGKGISGEFLRNHLYSAFKQEDALSVGTGLGLSIVRQVLLDIRGTIEIESELRSGTKAHVTMPVRVKELESPNTKVDTVTEVRNKLHGRRVRIMNEGFNVYPEILDEATGILSPKAQALIYLKSSVEDIMTSWFEMELVSPSDTNSSRVDVVVLMASEDIEDDIVSLDMTAANEGEAQVVVAICDAAYRGANITAKGIRIFYLRLPATPCKLASILHSAFCKPAVSPHLPNPSPVSHIKRDYETSNKDPSAQGVINAIKKVPSRPSLGSRKSSKYKSYTSITEEPSNSPSSPTSSNQPTIAPNTFRTLLVEDNAINLKILTQYMTKLAQSFITATDGLEAVSAYKSSPRPDTLVPNGSSAHTSSPVFDIIFMDLQMPTMDGLQATREIRRFEHEHGLEPAAVVALTGAASMSARQEAFSSGIDLFLVKPVAMRVLRDALVELRDKGRGALREFG